MIKLSYCRRRLMLVTPSNKLKFATSYQNIRQVSMRLMLWWSNMPTDTLLCRMKANWNKQFVFTLQLFFQILYIKCKALSQPVWMIRLRTCTNFKVSYARNNDSPRKSTATITFTIGSLLSRSSLQRWQVATILTTVKIWNVSQRTTEWLLR